jgi:DNA helicase-2/ATP-dependent DNA helicase PcrA
MLNPAQQTAVLATEGPVVIIAGPGTGKTHTFAHRAARLIESRKAAPSEILAVTFTRSGAREMRQRLAGLLPGVPLDELWLDTFHATALRILREQEYPFGPGVEVRLIAEEEKSAVADGLLSRREIPGLLEEVRLQKQKLSLPDQGPACDYQRRLHASRLLDFEDLFIHACRLFEERPTVKDRYRKRFRYILVDEFQDTSFAQYRFLLGLASQNLCVIGDPDQAIYGFAGDGFRPFERFKQDFPAASLVSLCDNYRSQAVILEAAKQIIRRNHSPLPRELRSRLEKGLPIEITTHPTERQEAELVVRKIEGLLGGASYFTIDSQWARKDHETYSYGFSDIAILYRLRAQARRLEEALQRAGFPYRVYGKKNKSDEGKDAEDLEDYQKNEEGVPKGEGITLMTVHRSKGLEFPVVFLVGCEEGLFPYSRSEAPHPTETEEERRLFYVGVTRAKNRLFLSHARQRMLFGKVLRPGPSPFLSDIEAELRVLQEARSPVKKKPAKDAQGNLFDLSSLE